MLTTRDITLAFIAASLVGTVACGRFIHQPVRSTVRPVGAMEPGPDGGPSDRITAAELATVKGTTADAVRRLRPQFLRVQDQRKSLMSSATTPSVYVNGRYAGEISVLDLIPLPIVLDIRYVDAVAAKSVFGSYCSCDYGVIFVRTAR